MLLKLIAAVIVIAVASGVIYFYAKFVSDNIVDYFKYKNEE